MFLYCSRALVRATQSRSRKKNDTYCCSGKASRIREKGYLIFNLLFRTTLIHQWDDIIVTEPTADKRNLFEVRYSTTLLTMSNTISFAERGALIVLEGLDCCGKTTQSNMLLDRLHSWGMASVVVRFPDRTTAVGSLIEKYLLETTDLNSRAIHLLFSANRWENVRKLEYHLFHRKETVICDRYAYSGAAYAVANSVGTQEESLSLEWCQQPDRGLPAPDVVIFFDISPEDIERRQGYVLSAWCFDDSIENIFNFLLAN